MGTYMTEAIVLKHEPWREADRAVVLYSREYGKMTAVARSARKISSKLAGCLEPFSLIQLTLAHGRTFETIAGADELYTYPKIRRHLPSVALAGLMAEIVDRSTYTSQPDQRLFELIDHSFRNLERTDRVSTTDAKMVTWRFVWRFLGIVGFLPELHHCQVCRERIREERNWFVHKKGGLVCPRCRQAADGGLAMEPDMIKIVRWLVADTPAPARIKTPEALSQAVGRLTNGFLNYTHEHDLDFTPFLKLA
ncbi:MAG: DNA repair protein RecO [Patescibacteria group bacterium]